MSISRVTGLIYPHSHPKCTHSCPTKLILGRKKLWVVGGEISPLKCHENGSSMFLRNAGVCLQECSVSFYRGKIYNIFMKVFCAIKILDQILLISTGFVDRASLHNLINKFNICGSVYHAL